MLDDRMLEPSCIGGGALDRGRPAAVRALPVAVAGLPIGLAVTEEAGYRFVAADARFALLDGSRFRRVEDARRAAGRLGRIVLAEDGDR